MSYIRRAAARGLKQGDSFSISRTFSEKEMIQFAQVSRDYNPVHFDQRFAAVKKFDNCICHGLLVGSMITEIGGQIGWLASGMNFRFIRPVYFKDTVTCDFTITKMDKKGRAEAVACFINQKGAKVLEGTLTGIVPGEQEQQVLKEMMLEGDLTNKAGR